MMPQHYTANPPRFHVMITLALITLFLPLACFALLGAVWPLRHTGKLAGWISSASAMGALGAAVAAAAQYQSSPVPVEKTVSWLVRNGETIAEIGIRVDGISISMMLVVTLVAACVQVYSLGYLDGEPNNDLGRYFAWQSLFVFSMVGLVLAPNMLQAFATWELVGLCSYLLIGYYWTKPSAGHAAVKAFWVTKFADMGLMLGIIILFVATGSFGWEQAPSEPVIATWVAGLIFMGVMGKSAQVPLHIWLPNAMEGPTPVSALLHAATMVAAGVFLIVRAYPLFVAAPTVLLIMVWVGALTAFAAACTAVVQNDIKKVLAYSTCSQLGYMVAALGSGTFTSGYFHLTTHAGFKALLFLGAGAAIHAVHSNDIFDMGGLLKKMPLASGLFIIGALALAGVPPFSGFFSKDLILEELLHAGQALPVGLLVLSAGLTAFYMTRVIVVAFLGQPKADLHAHTPATMMGPMLILGVPSLLLGFAGGAMADMWGAHYAFHLSTIGMVTTGVGVVGIAFGWFRYRSGKPTPLAAPIANFILAGPVDRLWVGAYRKGMLPLSKAIGWFDRYIVDGLPNMAAWVTIRGSNGIRGLQTGRVQDYVYALIIGVILFAAYGAVGR